MDRAIRENTLPGVMLLLELISRDELARPILTNSANTTPVQFP